MTCVNKIGFVTQDTNLFSGTIKENLMFVNPAATEEQLNDALQKASCTGLISRAEKGVDTMIGEGGFKIIGWRKTTYLYSPCLITQAAFINF